MRRARESTCVRGEGTPPGDYGYEGLAAGVSQVPSACLKCLGGERVSAHREKHACNAIPTLRAGDLRVQRTHRLYVQLCIQTNRGQREVDNFLQRCVLRAPWSGKTAGHARPVLASSKHERNKSPHATPSHAPGTPWQGRRGRQAQPKRAPR